MDNSVIVIISALLSGILATIITILVQKYSEKRKSKINIFETLMAHRYLISDKENVEALNKIDVVFYHHKKVKEAWAKFKTDSNNLTKQPDQITNVLDSYLKLLELMADAVGYKKISWDEIKTYYYPIGLSSKINEETLLRQGMLQQMKQSNTSITSNDFQRRQKEDIAMKFVLKALETPTGTDALLKLMNSSIAKSKNNVDSKDNK